MDKLSSANSDRYDICRSFVGRWYERSIGTFGTHTEYSCIDGQETTVNVNGKPSKLRAAQVMKKVEEAEDFGISVERTALETSISQQEENTGVLRDVVTRWFACIPKVLMKPEVDRPDVPGHTERELKNKYIGKAPRTKVWNGKLSRTFYIGHDNRSSECKQRDSNLENDQETTRVVTEHQAWAEMKAAAAARRRGLLLKGLAVVVVVAAIYFARR